MSDFKKVMAPTDCIVFYHVLKLYVKCCNAYRGPVVGIWFWVCSRRLFETGCRVHCCHWDQSGCCVIWQSNMCTQLVLYAKLLHSKRVNDKIQCLGVQTAFADPLVSRYFLRILHHLMKLFEVLNFGWLKVKLHIRLLDLAEMASWTLLANKGRLYVPFSARRMESCRRGEVGENYWRHVLSSVSS